jgi:hypothetical protein
MHTRQRRRLPTRPESRDRQPGSPDEAEGTWSLEIRRAGYADLRLDVAFSPRDTMPLTLVLSPRP